MIYQHRPGPMDQEAYDRAGAEAAGIIASGICPDPGNHRLRVRYLNERCLACGGHEGPQWAGTAVTDVLAVAADPVTAALLSMADDAIEHRAPDTSGCADCIRRDGSPCADHVADGALTARYEALRERIAAGEIAALTAQGGNER
jgi:hypothetical protein